MYKKFLKKLSCFFVTFAMILAYMPTKTSAAEDYNFSIAGVEVTSDHTSGDGWSYDNSSHTLTLNNANITTNSNVNAIYLNSSAPNLNIVLVGNNTLKTPETHTILVDYNQNITFSGSGTLNIESGRDGILVLNGASLTFNNVTANITAAWDGIRDVHELNIENSVVSIKSTNSDPNYKDIFCGLTYTTTEGSRTMVSGENSKLDVEGYFHAIGTFSGEQSIGFNADDGLGVYEPCGGYHLENVYPRNLEGFRALKNTDNSVVKHLVIQKLPAYTAKFVNYDNTELQSSQVTHGDTPTYTGETPTKPSDDQYIYTFSDWSPQPAPIAEETTYQAIFNQQPGHTIKFVNYDGTELQSEFLPEDETPSYNGSTPTKPATAQHTYTFSGWSPEITSVTGDATYTAQYTEEARQYNIKFVNYDGSELQNTQVAYGQMPSYTGTTPTKTEDAQYTYTFSGWDPEITSVTGDATYTAQYTQTTKKYHIIFVSEDGTELQNTEVEYGQTPVFEGEIPEKPADEDHSYVFGGWSPTIAPVTGEQTYRATYKPLYTILFVDDDGTTKLKEIKVPEGDIPSYGDTDPIKPETDEYVYTFAGWSPTPYAADSDAKYTATYTPTAKRTITFVDEDGSTVLKKVVLPEGELPSYGDTDPVKPADDNYVYTFAGWDPAITTVSGDKTYRATYTQTARHRIMFVNEDGTVLQNTLVLDEEMPEYTGKTPTKPADDDYTYTFAGWDPSIVPAIEDATYTATYEAQARTDNYETEGDPFNPYEITDEDLPEEDPYDEPLTDSTEESLADPEDSTAEQEKSEDFYAPKTGDEVYLLPWFILASVSSIWLAFDFISRKTRMSVFMNSINTTGLKK